MNEGLCEKLERERGRPKKQVSLCFLTPTEVHPEHVLLGKKKHSFAKDIINAPGGKQDPGETIQQCALRELPNESGLNAKNSDLEMVAEVDFYFEGNPEFDQTVIAYRITRYLGEPREVSDEIGEWQWCQKYRVPYDKTWPADRHWWPIILEKGKKLKARIVYGIAKDSGRNPIRAYEIKEVESLK